MAEPLIHVLIQYCNDPRPERAAEYDECVRRNLANPWIIAVHNLVEPRTIVPEEFKSHSKYKESPVSDWLTFRQAFEYANAHLMGETVALINLDIFLDPASDWAGARESVIGPLVLCQSRIEFDANGMTYKDPGLQKSGFATSQDAWIFKTPLKVSNCDFELGTLGCDNAIAHRIKAAKRIPINAADRFKIFHFDRVRGKHHMNQFDVHCKDRAERGGGRHPEREGQYLLPNFDEFRSVDQILDILKANEIQRYILICDLVSSAITLHNE